MADEKPDAPDLEFERYEHHGQRVWVRTRLQGKHREHCLCHRCELFTPGRRETSCLIATLLYTVCRLFGLVTPVWECPRFRERARDVAGDQPR